MIPILGMIFFGARSIEFFASGDTLRAWLHIGAALGFAYMFLVFYRKKESEQSEPSPDETEQGS